MSRFISWLSVAVAAGFLVVVSASASVGSITWLSFAISAGTLVLSATLAYRERAHLAGLITAGAITVISAWTVVASLIFSPSTVQDLALGSSLAIVGLAIAGLTAHEAARERVATSGKPGSDDAKLAAAA